MLTGLGLDSESQATCSRKRLLFNLLTASLIGMHPWAVFAVCDPPAAPSSIPPDGVVSMNFRPGYYVVRGVAVLLLVGLGQRMASAQTGYPMLMSLKPVAAQVGQTSELTVNS